MTSRQTEHLPFIDSIKGVMMLIWPEGRGGHLFQVQSHVTGRGTQRQRADRWPIDGSIMWIMNETPATKVDSLPLSILMESPVLVNHLSVVPHLLDFITSSALWMKKCLDPCWAAVTALSRLWRLRSDSDWQPVASSASKLWVHCATRRRVGFRKRASV